jgi:putative ATPase
MDLFADDSIASDSGFARERQPLAARMRPKTLDAILGQHHLVGEGSLLRRMLENGHIRSCIFYGPPSSGKTTLASVISRMLKARFVQLNAVLDGVKELKTVVGQAQEWEKVHRQQTILFVDEIHRWNRAQQDALLPHVESGLLTLIGATTENPFYALVGPLLSRCQLFELRAPSVEDIIALLYRAVSDRENGFGHQNVTLQEKAADYIARQCGGDIRSALNALEMCVLAAPVREDGIVISETDAMQAFIKSVRGSDADAALYWMVAMIESGEDPAFVFRRMLIFCSEDIGLADPHALPLVHAAHESFLKTGMPEGWYFLGHACVYCAMAPKSNSTAAVFEVIKAVQDAGVGTVPPYLRDKTASGLKSRFTGLPDYSKDYKYPHDYPGHWVAQRYLPEGVQGNWFKPGNLGWEKRLLEIQKLMRSAEASG